MVTIIISQGGYLKVITVLFFLLISSLSFSRSFGVHKVKEGETISTILYELGLYPLYGKDGWTEQVLKLNRVTLKKSRGLEPGDMLIIPIDKEKPVKREDLVSVKQSGFVKSGLLSRSSSKSYGFLIYTDIGKKNFQIDVANSYNYGIGFELISLKKHSFLNLDFNLNYGIYVNTQRSVSLGSEGSTYAQFSPEVNLYANALFDVSDFSIGPTLRVEEESVVDNDGSSIFVRRDRKLSLGLLLKYHKVENVLLSLGSYYSVYSENLNDYESNRTLTSFLTSDFNLINNFKVGFFGEIDSIDRRDSSYGIRLTKIFK